MVSAAVRWKWSSGFEITYVNSLIFVQFLTNNNYCKCNYLSTYYHWYSRLTEIIEDQVRKQRGKIYNQSKGIYWLLEVVCICFVQLGVIIFYCVSLLHFMLLCTVSLLVIFIIVEYFGFEWNGNLILLYFGSQYFNKMLYLVYIYIYIFTSRFIGLCKCNARQYVIQK